MHNNNSEVLAFKKFFIPSTSVRATLNFQPDHDVKKNLSYLAPAQPKNKPITNITNKNMQSFSTSALPYYNPAEQVNNCEANISAAIKNNDHADPIISDFTTESFHKIKKNAPDLQFHTPKAKKDSLSHRQQLPTYNKSTTQLNLVNLRQTTNNNSSAPFIPKHRHPEWLQKMQSYSKTAKSTKINLIQQISQKQEQSNSPTFQAIHESPGKNNQDHKLFFRQTLDPQMDRNFGEPKIPSLSPNFFTKKIKQKEQKDLSKTKLEKTIKNESKNKTQNLTFNQGGFWKNKAVSPPSKPWPPQKIDLSMSKQISVPPLPIHSNEKVTAHKPSFFMNKKSLNRFSIMKQLGSGSISDAFLCMDKKSNAIFCLKRYHKATIKNFPEVLDNFIKKVAFQFLAEDPNIIQLYDIFCDGQFIYTIEQYMESGKLSENMQKQIELRQEKRRQTQNFMNTNKEHQEPLFNQSKIIDKIYDINSALCYIHQSCETASKINKKKMPPLVHGDVRTKSILVCMGVCKLPTIEPANIKSYYINSYSPPEQIIEQVYIAKSDIWNLGLILFQLCAERKLFGHAEGPGQHDEEDNKPGYQVFNVNITEQIDKLAGTTQLLKELIKKLLAIQPEDRPSSNKVMESHVFRMYGFDVQWKQRRNQKMMKIKQIKDLKQMDRQKYKKHSISLQELKLQSQIHHEHGHFLKKQHDLNNGKSNNNLNHSRDLNCTHDSNQNTETPPVAKTHWTKSRLSVQKKY